MKYIHTNEAPKALGPYSQAVAVNGFLFTSGQIPFSPKTNKLVSSDIKEQTHQVMNNLKAILTEAGTNFNKVVKCNIYLKDLNDFDAVNEVYATYFNDINLPARECIEVARLPKDVSLEISLIVSL